MGLQRVEPQLAIKSKLRERSSIEDWQKRCVRFGKGMSGASKVLQLRSGRTMMSGTNTNLAGGSDPIELTATSGSTSSSGPNASTTSAQSSVAIPTSIGNTRWNTEFEQKRFFDENCSNPTAGGNLNSDANSTAGGSLNSDANPSAGAVSTLVQTA
ncbi:hypothetical protein PIB30_060540 [Stylosanthes scabra]|uniref:Uncharacterized protein n=1 Tax=Stylosanthes scabra TaxID=79078 RepID=A0ABU6YK02_9FABA|nr:hypothetical protein [Stylosanthes scabra]